MLEGLLYIIKYSANVKSHRYYKELSTLWQRTTSHSAMNFRFFELQDTLGLQGIDHRVLVFIDMRIHNTTCYHKSVFPSFSLLSIPQLPLIHHSIPAIQSSLEPVVFLPVQFLILILIAQFYSCKCSPNPRAFKTTGQSSVCGLVTSPLFNGAVAVISLMVLGGWGKRGGAMCLNDLPSPICSVMGGPSSFCLFSRPLTFPIFLMGWRWWEILPL